MKTFNASDLSHKRAEVMKAARDDGAIIQEKRTNGEVREIYICRRVTKEEFAEMYPTGNVDELNGGE